MAVTSVRRSETIICEDTIAEIVRIARITDESSAAQSISEELGGLIDVHFYWDAFQLIPQPARWNGATEKELRRLRNSLHKLRLHVRGLSTNALGFIYGPSTYCEGIMRVRVPHAIEAIDEFEQATTNLLRSVERGLTTGPTTRARRSNIHFDDEDGPFYSFAACLISMIIRRGGRATVDKNCRSGTVIAVLDVLKPYLPEVALPEFLTDASATGGLHRLDLIRSQVAGGGF